MIAPDLEELIEKLDEKIRILLKKSTNQSKKPINQVILELLNPDENEKKKLREMYPSLFLTPSDKDRLQELIANNELYKQHIRFKDLYTSEDEQKLLRELSSKIHNSLPDEDKRRFTVSDVYSTLKYIPIMNLGVIEIASQNKARDFKKYMKEHIGFFLGNQELAVRVLKNHYLKKGETLYNGELRRFIEDTQKELVEIGANKNGKSGKSLAELVTKELEERVDYSHKLYQRSRELKLFFHQTNRIYETVENGARRVLCADATGAGKTIIAATTKFLLDEKRKKKGKAIVFAPGQTMDSVWSQASMSSYAANLNLEERIQNQKVATISTYSDFKKIDDDTDFIVINYDKFGLDRDYKNNRYWRRTIELCDEVDMAVFDEAHTLKNPSKNAPRAFAEIIEKTKDKRALLLTATPCPNRLRDIGYILYMLNPQDKRFAKYKDTPFVYNLDTSAIRDVMLKGQWFMFSKEAVERIFGLPSIHKPKDSSELVYLQMNDQEAQEYFKIWRPSGSVGQKLYPLRKVLMNNKIRQIESIARKFANENQQAIIYTSLKKGIVKPIQAELEKVYGHGRVAIIDGDIHNFKRKVGLAKKFQQGDYKAIVCTGVMGEGIDLSCGNKRVDLVITEPCITPREYLQLIGRPHRPGQREDVYVHVLSSKSKYLETLMRAEIAALEEEYNVKFRRNWQPTTIDIDRFNITEAKQRIFEEAIRRALPLPKDMAKLMDIDDSQNSQTNSRAHSSTVSLDDFKKLAKEKEKNNFFGKNVNRCSNLKGQKYNPNVLAPLVIDYGNKESWKYSTAAESNRVAVNLIKELEKANKIRYSSIADLGSGPACLARLLKEENLEKKVDCIDGMEKMIELGRRFCKEEDVENVKFYKRKMWDTKFKSRKYNIVTCLNALHYNDQEKDRDIEKILIEANRILKKDGYFIVGLIPSNKTDLKHDITNLSEAIGRYGFDVRYNNIIQVKGLNEKTGKKEYSKVPIIVAKKINNSSEITGDIIPIYYPLHYVSTGGGRRITIFDEKEERRRRKRELVGKEYITHNGQSLTSEVKKWA
ncbi:DEAD/DEAH box helicase family protein [Candidatus Woesearchaeota archaeon]|nr:DEAD/DEAH box helicase family protein [Candidatus Woesearchaeota archaeon]